MYNRFCVYKDCKIWILLIAAVVAYTVFFTHLSILKYKAFFSFSPDDLAIKNNLLWHTSKGNIFYQSIGERLLDNHFGFFYVFLALFYKLFPHIFTVFALLQFGLALGVVPVYYIAKRWFNSQTATLLLAFSYLLFNPLHQLSFVDHNVVMSYAITFILFSFWAFDQEKLGQFVIFSLLSMACREETSFIIVMFAAYAIIKKMPLCGKIIPIILGGGYFTAIWCFIAPLMDYNQYDNPYIWNFFKVNPDQSSLLQLTSRHFGQLSSTFFSFHHLITILKFIGLPLSVLALWAPEVLLLSLPVFLGALFAIEEYYLSIESVHHLAFLIPFIFISSILGLCRIAKKVSQINFVARRISTQALTKNFALLFLLFNLFSNFGENILLAPGGEYGDIDVVDERFMKEKNMYNPIFYTQDQRDQAAWEFIQLVPQGASVSTTATYLPAFSARDRVYHFGTTPLINDRDGHDFEAEYVFLNKDDDYVGFGGIETRHAYIDESIPLLLQHGYVPLKEDNRFILLKK